MYVACRKENHHHQEEENLMAKTTKGIMSFGSNWHKSDQKKKMIVATSSFPPSIFEIHVLDWINICKLDALQNCTLGAS